jgi:hypothetical protein
VNLRLIRKAMLPVMAALCAAGCGGGSSSGGGEGSSVDTITITSNATIDCFQANPMSVTLQATGNSAPLTWNVTRGTLPAGLSLDSKSGTISGIPQNNINQDVVTIVAGEGKAVGTKDFSFSVFPKDTFNPITPPNAHLNAPYSLILNGTGSNDPKYASISISAGSLPAGITLSQGGPTSGYLGIIAGTPTQVGSFPFTLQMKDTSISDLPQTVTASATLVVDTHLTILKSSLNNAVQGKAYSDTFRAVDGTPPYQWSLKGSVPPGLTLDAASGALSGTTTLYGSYSYTVSVTDASAPVESDSATNSMAVVSPLTVMEPATLTANIGQSYFVPLLANGGTPPYKWNLVSGSLPSGLTLSSLGGINGTPSQLGSFAIVLGATDSGTPPQTASQAVTLSVTPVGLAVSGQPLSPAPVNVAYHSQIAVYGGTPPFSWTVSSGNLPPGLTLNAATGSIDGTPTQNGTYNFVPQITDSGNPAQVTSTNEFIVIQQGLGRNDSIATATPLGNSANFTNPLPFSISPYIDPIAAATANPDTDYYKLIAQAGSTVHVETQAQRTITGDTLDSVIEILNSSGQRMTACTTPAFNSSCLNDDIDATTTDSALDFLVPGTVNTNTTFYLHVFDWRGDARPDMQYHLVIAGVTEPLTLSPTSLGSGATRGVNYQQQFTAAGGSGTATWSVSGGALPPGWSLSATGLLSGTPTTNGTYTFSITATDSGNPAQSKSQQFTVQMADPVAFTSPTTLPDACVTKPYSYQLTTSGGVPPLSFYSDSGYSFDTGLGVNPETGVYGGTARLAGTYTIPIQVSDAAQPASRQYVQFTINLVTCP